MTLSKHDYDAFHIIRKGITGGLSNIQHRVNLAGITRINKLYYDLKTNTIYDKDTDHVMTHYMGVDFNSLYPSAFSSTQHEFIPYTNRKMYMPGCITNTYKCDSEKIKKIALDIISKKNRLFIVVVRGHIPKEHLNKFINFLPIFRNIEITTDEKT